EVRLAGHRSAFDLAGHRNLERLPLEGNRERELQLVADERAGERELACRRLEEAVHFLAVLLERHLHGVRALRRIDRHVPVGGDRRLRECGRRNEQDERQNGKSQAVHCVLLKWNGGSYSTPASPVRRAESGPSPTLPSFAVPVIAFPSSVPFIVISSILPSSGTAHTA